MKKFLVLQDHETGNILKNEIVYLFQKYDYGLSQDDSQTMGELYLSVTRDPQGDYPSYTIPERKLMFLEYVNH